jgi:hypothetical protein
MDFHHPMDLRQPPVAGFAPSCSWQRRNLPRWTATCRGFLFEVCVACHRLTRRAFAKLVFPAGLLLSTAANFTPAARITPSWRGFFAQSGQAITMNRTPSTRPNPGAKLINIGLSLLAASVVIGIAASGPKAGRRSPFPLTRYEG